MAAAPFRAGGVYLATALDHPVLRVSLAWGGDGRLVRVRLGDDGTALAAEAAAAGATLRMGCGLAEHVEQVRGYLDGRTRRFRIPVHLCGTPFQEAAWRVLTRIPYGATWTYGRQARAMGRPGAARAVGRANGANPIPIVVPCHRVVPACGGLGGFSAGVSYKRRLLALEGAYRD